MGFLIISFAKMLICALWWAMSKKRFLVFIKKQNQSTKFNTFLEKS